MSKKKLTQDEVNKLYKQKYITVGDASRLMGVTRQHIWYMIDNPLKAGPHFNTVEQDGDMFVETASFHNFLAKYRLQLLEKLDKLHLPSEF